MRILLINNDGPDRWQVEDDIQVMVSNRDGKDTQVFCPAREIKIRDNVWEHNIVRSIEILDAPKDGVKFHYGARVK